MDIDTLTIPGMTTFPNREEEFLLELRKLRLIQYKHWKEKKETKPKKEKKARKPRSVKKKMTAILSSAFEGMDEETKKALGIS